MEIKTYIEDTLKESNKQWLSALELNTNDRINEYAKLIGYLEGRLRMMEYELNYKNN